MKTYIKRIINEALSEVFKDMSIPADVLPSFSVEPPKNHDHGDYTSSVAFSLSRYAKKSPQELGEKIRDKIEDIDNKLNKIDVISGYLNFFFKQEVYSDILRQINIKKEEFSKLNIGEGRKILLEFISANPTGPLHVGHGRGAVFGDTLSRILRHAGYNVVNEYYINDAGNQVRELGKSIYSEYCNNFGVKKEPGEYRGSYINEIAQEIVKQEGKEYLSDSNQALEYFTDCGVKKILNKIKDDLARLNINMDSWVSEKELFEKGSVQNILERLKDSGYVYKKDDALWFSSMKFGDDKDRVLIKADGEKTYLSSDIAYHNEKFSRSFDEYINIWGADHHGYLPRLKASLTALGLDAERLKVIFVQMVHLTRGGKPVQMSKRSGEYVSLRELIDEVKSDATRFFFLMREPESSLNFDIELAKRQSADNPVYYVQYAHARICSIFREAESKGIIMPEPDNVALDLLNYDDERRLVRMLIHFQDEIERSAKTLSVHNITYFLIELANEFHKYYNNYRVLDENQKLRDARMLLVNAVKIVINTGLKLLGISAPEQM